MLTSCYSNFSPWGPTVEVLVFFFFLLVIVKLVLKGKAEKPYFQVNLIDSEEELFFVVVILFLSFFFSFIFISRRLITSQHGSGFCHTLT